MVISDSKTLENKLNKDISFSHPRGSNFLESTDGGNRTENEEQFNMNQREMEIAFHSGF